MPELHLPQQDKTVRVESGGNLFECLRQQGLPVQSACGGMGTCGKCRVKFLENPPPPKASEQAHLNNEVLAQGVRLACLHPVEQDLVLGLFEANASTDAKEQLKTELDVALEPGVEKLCVSLACASRRDQRPDVVRVEQALKRGRLDWSKSALTSLHRALRQDDFRVTLTLAGDRVLDAEAQDARAHCYGVAFDVGTTTIAGYLFDLGSGRELAVKSLMNPQRGYGGDVISRIKHVRDRGQAALDELQRVLRSGINALLKVLCREALIEPRHVYKTVFAGNPTMMHFLLGLDPSGLDHSPYIPVTRNLMTFKAGELQFDIHPEGRVCVLPNLSAYVGGDITAGVLASGLHRAQGVNLLVDIGTNAEIVLGNEQRLIACSSPAGPAFEGAEIQCGMSANPGAISHVTMSAEGLELEVIANVPPKGICGSGLIDAVGQLLALKLVAHRGNLHAVDGLSLSGRVTLGDNGQPRFLLSDEGEPIYLTQKDVRELQLAKGAVRAGVDIALQQYGIAEDQLDHIYLAGAFGNFLRVENVLRVGLLPNVSPEKVAPVGNAAGTGAVMCLLNEDKLDEIQTLTERMEYFELSNYEKFSDVFMGSMLFPEDGPGKGV